MKKAMKCNAKGCTNGMHKSGILSMKAGSGQGTTIVTQAKGR